MNKRKLGFAKEDEAAGFLTECGLKILELNYSNRFGEIDITGIGHGDVVFLPQILHGDTYTGLLKIHVVGDIDRADDR